ncbi:MAG TPA: hypothetical protein VGQ19_06590 [Burkholderiales bacterium]|jgi:hypothetical protein|nr:hypothetical protein [Burkholderiales bacterium]
MKCIVDMDALMDMDEPIENLKNATAALVMAHSDLDQDTFAGKAIAFLCNAMTRDAYDLAEAWGRICGEKPAAETAADKD